MENDINNPSAWILLCYISIIYYLDNNITDPENIFWIIIWMIIGYHYKNIVIWLIILLIQVPKYGDDGDDLIHNYVV